MKLDLGTPTLLFIRPWDPAYGRQPRQHCFFDALRPRLSLRLKAGYTRRPRFDVGSRNFRTFFAAEATMKLDLGKQVPLAFSHSPKRNLQQELLLRLSRIKWQVPGVLMGLGTLSNHLRRAQ